MATITFVIVSTKLSAARGLGAPCIANSMRYATRLKTFSNGSPTSLRASSPSESVPLPGAGRGQGLGCLPDRSAKLPIVRHQPVTAQKLGLAKHLRHEMTAAERTLWAALRRNALEGLHFRRQQVIGGYIADFYCDAARLAVEIDSPAHALRAQRDARRDRELNRTGVCVIRFLNEIVFGDLDLVLNTIARCAARRIARRAT